MINAANFGSNGKPRYFYGIKNGKEKKIRNQNRIPGTWRLLNGTAR